MSETLLKLTNFEFSYSPSPFLKIPSFELQKGETVFVEGPSGVGKTTWLELLSGILSPLKGEYWLAGKRVDQLTAQQKDQLRLNDISLIFQGHNLVPFLSVMENLLLPFWLGAPYPQSEAETVKKATEFMQRLGLSGLEKNKVSEISQGQAQRVAAIRSLLKKPKLLLADEPTSSLDFKTRDEFMSLLIELCQIQQTSLIFVSHDVSLKKHFSRVVSLKDWRI
ncbi:MAG: ABC transporter ATP-binding protein [Bdellovibrionales bacterium]